MVAHAGKVYIFCGEYNEGDVPSIMSSYSYYYFFIDFFKNVHWIFLTTFPKKFRATKLLVIFSVNSFSAKTFLEAFCHKGKLVYIFEICVNSFR
jgi:hypothetical protein